MRRAHVAIRVNADDLAEIDRQAQALNLSRTQFLIRSALGRLPDHEQDIDRRLERLEDSIQRLETALFTN